MKSIVLSASSTLSIARELHLSDEQQRLLDQLHALTCASIRRAILRAADDLDESPDLARAELAKSGAVVRDVIQHAEKIATTAILTRKQAERLQQIAWHMQGPRALMEDEVSEKLALTKQQKEQIRRLGDRVSTLHTSATESGGGPGGASSPQARPERDFPKLIMETEAEMENVLNPAQRKKWAELKGPKFDLRQTDPK